MYLAVLLPSVLALFAIYKRKLTVTATIIAWLFGILITYCGGTYAFIALATTFILTILTDKLKKDKDDEKRDEYQILSNVLTATYAILLYYFKNNITFLVMYYAVMGSSLADTLASSIGSEAKGKTYHPLFLREMKKGESGAVSNLGISASFMGGFIIGAIYYIIETNLINSLIIVLMSALGSYIDSLLGAFCQAKYECPKCNKQVETPKHCRVKTTLLRGYPFMNNNVVNLLSNICIFIITYLIMILK